MPTSARGPPAPRTFQTFREASEDEEDVYYLVSAESDVILLEAEEE
jgi:hypothetical protein